MRPRGTARAWLMAAADPVGRELAMGIVWIASYPKSGNTWVRFLLANYLLGPIGHSGEVEQLIPYVGKIGDPWARLAGGGRLYSKSHFPFGVHPLAPLTERSVYIFRHPKDILLSNLNYKRLLKGSAAAFSDAAYAREFIANGGDRDWQRFGFGPLDEHVKSWLERHPRPLLLVKYEDIKSDAGRELTRILEFLELAPDPERVAGAVARSAFEQMRSMEVREKSEGRASEVFAKNGPAAPGEEPRYFMSEGRTTHSLAHLAPDLDGEFERRFGPVLERMGYAPAPRALAGTG